MGPQATWLLTVLAISLLLVPLGISIRRSTELFRVKVRNGKAIFVRGRIPQSLLTDIDDIVRTPSVAHAEVWAVRSSGKAVLETKGDIPRDQLQRLRNVLGTYTLQRILAGGRRAGR